MCTCAASPFKRKIKKSVFFFISETILDSVFGTAEVCTSLYDADSEILSSLNAKDIVSCATDKVTQVLKKGVQFSSTTVSRKGQNFFFLHINYPEYVL